MFSFSKGMPHPLKAETKTQTHKYALIERSDIEFCDLIIMVQKKHCSLLALFGPCRIVRATSDRQGSGHPRQLQWREHMRAVAISFTCTIY